MKISFKKRTPKKRNKESIPGVLYGPGMENIVLEVDSKEFMKAYEDAGESSLINLEPFEGSEKYLVLIHDTQRDPLTGNIIHIDFYQPDLKKEVEVEVPLRFTGEAPAVKELGGTLVRNFLEVEVSALPEKLPYDIEVNVDKLVTFDDIVTIADLVVPEGVEILKESDEIIALVTPIVVEEEPEPIEEDVDSVEKIEKKEKEEGDEEE
ncbi:MAG: 50S ribosomal protein L25 [Minisyncoccales bacterium]|jgi:large subunit ribosomal protein L25